MIRLEYALAAGAIACAAVAAAVPTRFDLVEINLSNRRGVVDIDGTEVTVHAPDVEYRLARSTAEDDERAFLYFDRVAGGDSIIVGFVQGGRPRSGRTVGERDGRPIRLVIDTPRTLGVGWEVVDDAIVVVSGPTDDVELLLGVIEAMEIDA